MAETHLTAKQQRFVEEYCTDFNATQAAIRAGYSRRTARQIGHENLTKPDISAAVGARLSALAMSTAEILARLTAIARGSLAPFLKADEAGRVQVDLTSEMAQKNLHMLKTVEVRLTESSGAEGRSVTTRVRLELHDALDALETLARIRGLYDAEAHLARRFGVLVVPVE